MKWKPVSRAVHASLLIACGATLRTVAQQGPVQPAAPPDSEARLPLAPNRRPRALARTAPAAATKSSQSNAPAQGNAGQMQEVTVTAQRLNLIGVATTASQGVVVNSEITLTPAYRPGQVLETVPGLDVTTHSGEGKANQYLMRGYNLDHGTDLAVFVDGMPINEPTHAHGQGYADINFMIPELATNISYTKGTYYADEGDFASVGSIHINYLNTIPDQASVTVGTEDFQHYLVAGSTQLGSGNLLGALETQHYDGPWTTPGDQRKVNMVLRFSTGDTQEGYSLTAMFYHDLWNAQTDQPERALTEGLISSPYSELDPSDAGYAERSSLSWMYHEALGEGVFTANAYVISNHLTLWNDFTHFLVDPINGDQEEQHEDRTTVGGDASYAWTTQIGGFSNDWLTGLHSRFDYNDVRASTQRGSHPADGCSARGSRLPLCLQ